MTEPARKRRFAAKRHVKRWHRQRPPGIAGTGIPACPPRLGGVVDSYQAAPLGWCFPACVCTAIPVLAPAAYFASSLIRNVLRYICSVDLTHDMRHTRRVFFGFLPQGGVGSNLQHGHARLVLDDRDDNSRSESSRFVNSRSGAVQFFASVHLLRSASSLRNLSRRDGKESHAEPRDAQWKPRRLQSARKTGRKNAGWAEFLEMTLARRGF